MALCALPGCSKFAFFDQSTGKQHECCGKTHHVMEMVRRNVGLLFKPPKSDLCQLASCSNPAHSGHDFCSKAHALKFIEETQRRSTRRCELPGCGLPVFVEKTAGGWRTHDFCGWTHAKLARFQGEVEVTKEMIVQCLLEWTASGKIMEIPVDENFWTKHPWEIISKAKKSIWLIVPLKYKKSKRDNTTLEGCFWKQQGDRSVSALNEHNVENRNMTYTGKKAGHCSHLSFHVVEYVLQRSDPEKYGVIRLKSKFPETSKPVKRKRNRKVTHEEAMEITDAVLKELPDRAKLF